MDQREYRIRQLEEKVENLDTLRDQILAVGWAAKWGLRILFAVGGYGLVDAVGKIMHWLQSPLKVGK